MSMKRGADETNAEWYGQNPTHWMSLPSRPAAPQPEGVQK